MSFSDKFKKAAELLRKTPKATAEILLREAQDSLKGRNSAAEGILQQQINVASALAKRHQPLRAYHQPLTDDSIPLQNNALKINAALTLYPNQMATTVIKNLLTASNHKLIEETIMMDGRKQLAVWNERKQARDIYEEIYTERGSYLHNRPQFTAYYNVADRSISINYAGTGFTSPDDLQSALQTISEEESMRMTRVRDCIDQMVKAFNKKYPGQITRTPIDIYAHSAGANAVALTNYFLQREHSLVPRAQIMIDPFGAKNSFNQVAAMAAQAEGRSSQTVLDELTRNIITFKPSHGTFIDGFKKLKFFNPALGNAPETIGPVRTANVGGNSFSAHQVRTWVKYFNNEELREAQKPAGRILRKFTGKQPH